MANLGNERAPALQLIDDLMQYNWVDRHTRALFVEFNIYNANTNLFNMVTLCFELPPEGSYLTTSRIMAIQLYRLAITLAATVKSFVCTSMNLNHHLRLYFLSDTSACKV